jgi:hypothetical protein
MTSVVKALAVLGIKLRVPVSEQLDLLLLLGQQRVLYELLVVPDHDVAANVDRFAPDDELDEPREVPWSVEEVRQFLHQRLDGRDSLEDRNAPKNCLQNENHVGWSDLPDVRLDVQALEGENFEHVGELHGRLVLEDLIDCPSGE